MMGERVRIVFAFIVGLGTAAEIDITYSVTRQRIAAVIAGQTDSALRRDRCRIRKIARRQLIPVPREDIMAKRL
jgi:hypothetical protein